MTGLTLTKTRIHAGRYEGVMTCAGEEPREPEIIALHQSLPLADLSVTPDPSAPRTWFVSVPIPPNLLTDGVQTFLIKDETNGDTLDSFTIVTGEPLGDDLRAEIELLRAELDMLKRAFRRHCVETAG